MKLYNILTLVFFSILVNPVFAKSICEFDRKILSFSGTPIEQTQCLLRDVNKWGEIDERLKILPSSFGTLLSQKIPVTKEELALYLSKSNILQSIIGGSLTTPLSTANSGRSDSIFAKYFVIHDTSTPNYEDKNFPNNINDENWKYNDLTMWEKGDKSLAHVFINRLGQSVSPVKFSKPWRATKFEIDYGSKDPKGLFLHIELVQPRKTDPKGKKGNDALSPSDGFTPKQYERLALVYLSASIRREDWLIPAFHAILDLDKKGGHDDPQNFSLEKWSQALSMVIHHIKEGNDDGKSNRTY